MLKRNVVVVFEIAMMALSPLFLFTQQCLAFPQFDLSSASVAVGAGPIKAPERQSPIALPPMGWSSWNSFSNTVDSNVIIEQTKALLASGMKKAGYQYINIDEGWWLGERNQNGNIVVNPTQWPALQTGEHAGDMSNIVRYIHGAGLKAGIYTDAGEAGCGFYGPDIGPPMPHTGSEGHYDQDFLQFAQWGFDYVKVDWCGGNKENLDPAVQYGAIAHAIDRAEKMTGHRLFYSICEWGFNSPWTWASGVGGVFADIWRTSGDIVAPIVGNIPDSTRIASFKGVLSNFDQGIHPAAQHTGYYNDPDMMVVGMHGLTATENRAHMSLWAISGSPLIVGADLTKLENATKAILTNPEVIAIDQDPLGVQSIKVDEPRLGIQVWTKPMAAVGEHAVLLLNRTAVPSKIDVKWSEIGLNPSSTATVRDVWDDKELGAYLPGYAATVSAGDAALLVIHGVDGKASRYEASSSVNEFEGGASAEPCPACSNGRSVLIGGLKSLTFKIAPLRGAKFVQISYINRTNHPQTVELRVDGQLPTRILFPPTGEEVQVGSIMIEVESKQAGSVSTLSFLSPDAPGPALISLSVLAGTQE